MKQVFLLLTIICVPGVANATCSDSFKDNNTRSDKELISDEMVKAIRTGNKEEVAQLVSEGIDVNLQDKDGNTAFMLASYRGHNEIMKFLSEHPKVDKNIRNHNGETALILASKAGDIEIVKFLSEDLEVDKNLQDNEGYTALIKAIRFRHKKIVKFLSEDLEVDMNLQDKDGNTALIYAVKVISTDMVKTLLKNLKVDMDLRDKDGNTAFMIADQESARFISIKRMLWNPDDFGRNSWTAKMIKKAKKRWKDAGEEVNPLHN